MDHTAQTDDGSTDGQTRGSTRRRVLRGTAVAGLTAAGVGTATAGVSAQFSAGATTISVSEGSGWFGGGGWSADGSLPVTDELLVFFHGWFGNIADVAGQADDVRASLESGGYTPDETVGIEWPAVNPDANAAAADTESVGDVVAGLIEDYDDAGGGNVRVVGHSMGARCTFWTLTKLASGHEVETAATLGAAASGPEICGDPWNPGIGNACQVRNYFSNNDSVVGGEGPLDTKLGYRGANCDPGPNYADVDVTNAVGDHLAYLGNETVGADLAQAIHDGSCNSGTGGGSDGSGDSGGSGGSDGFGGWW